MRRISTPVELISIIHKEDIEIVHDTGGLCVLISLEAPLFQSESGFGD